MSILFYAHSWLRYLVLLTSLAALITLTYSVATDRATRLARNLSTSFAGVLDLQILFGIFLMMGGMHSDAVTGHLLLMIFAAVVTHGAFLIGQQVRSERSELAIRLGGTVVALALIVVGIVAIGQTILGRSAAGRVGYTAQSRNTATR
jgi:heme A synthase